MTARRAHGRGWRAVALMAALASGAALAQSPPAWPTLPGAAEAHHPVGRALPSGIFGLAFRQPDAREGELHYYDVNANGIADAEEVRYYGPGRTVECGSCHLEPAAGAPAADLRLRSDNRDSRLCLLCHRM